MNCVHYNFHMYHVSACVRVYYQWYDVWRVSARVGAVCASRTRTLWHARDRTVCAVQYFCTKLAHADVLTCNLSACVRLACVCARARTHGHPETSTNFTTHECVCTFHARRCTRLRSDVVCMYEHVCVKNLHEMCVSRRVRATGEHGDRCAIHCVLHMKFSRNDDTQ